MKASFSFIGNKGTLLPSERKLTDNFKIKCDQLARDLLQDLSRKIILLSIQTISFSYSFDSSCFRSQLSFYTGCSMLATNCRVTQKEIIILD